MTQNSNDTQISVTCLTEDGRIDFTEHDSQVMVTPGSSDQICLGATETRYLGIWLICVASRIEGRFPEMVSD